VNPVARIPEGRARRHAAGVVANNPFERTARQRHGQAPSVLRASAAAQRERWGA